MTRPKRRPGRVDTSPWGADHPFSLEPHLLLSHRLLCLASMQSQMIAISASCSATTVTCFPCPSGSIKILPELGMIRQLKDNINIYYCEVEVVDKW